MTDNELVKAEREKELVDCLTWLQHRMDEYDDKEAYQDDYKMASIAWNFIRARMAENAALKEAQRWVATSERLPEPLRIYSPPDIKNTYLVACFENKNPNGYFYGYNLALYMSDGKGGANWYGDDGSVGLAVTHWCNLPQPPEKG